MPSIQRVVQGTLLAAALFVTTERTSAQTTASPAPSTSASPSPTSAAAIVLDRGRVALLPGGTVVVHVGGGGTIVVTSPLSPTVDVRYDPLARALVLTGRAPGTTVVTLGDDAGDTAQLPVLVAPPAGIVPSDVNVEFGGVVSPQFADERIREAIAADAQLRPGTRIDVSGTTPSGPLRPGSTYETIARVHVDGANAYVDTDGTTSVHVRVDTLAQLDPEILFYSDDPERLESGIDGVLYRGTLEPAKPARAYVYHVSANSTHDLYLVLRAQASDARVEVLGAAAGPSDAFSYVGHRSTLKYLVERQAQESAIVPVTHDEPYVVPLGAHSLGPGELVAGIFDTRVLDGGAVDIMVIATENGADPLAFADQPEHAGDGHFRRGEFDLTAVPPIALTFAAGAPDPPPFAVGLPTIANLRPGGRSLGGDYGALRAVSLRLSNPDAVPAMVYLYEVATGGTVTTTMSFAGDTAPIEVPCVVRPNRYTIKAFTLGPGETRDVAGEYMTDGTSSFPLYFGLTSSPPSPPPGPYAPDACNPRTPPSTPAPTPNATPV